MKLDFRCKACAVAIALLTAIPAAWSRPVPQMGHEAGAQAQGQATVLGDLIKDWQRQQKTIMAIADAMPEDKFSYKTTPAQRDYGEQVMHIALINVQLLKFIGGKATPPTFPEDSAKNKAEALKALSDSYDYGLALLKEQTDSSIVETVKGPGFLGPSTRARIFWNLLVHTEDIYGQMAVYLRMNGIVPPASRKSMP